MQRHPGLLHRKAGQWCQTEEQPELVQERLEPGQLEPGQLEHCTHFHSHQALAQHPSQRLQALVQHPFRLVREEQQVHRRPHELQEQCPFHWWCCHRPEEPRWWCCSCHRPEEPVEQQVLREREQQVRRHLQHHQR